MTFTKNEVFYAIYASETPPDTQLSGKYVIDSPLFIDKIFTDPTYKFLFECANEIVKYSKSSHIYFEGVFLKQIREDGVKIISISLAIN
jgi:hypothetical protein